MLLYKSKISRKPVKKSQKSNLKRDNLSEKTKKKLNKTKQKGKKINAYDHKLVKYAWVDVYKPEIRL